MLDGDMKAPGFRNAARGNARLIQDPPRANHLAASDINTTGRLGSGMASQAGEKFVAPAGQQRRAPFPAGCFELIPYTVGATNRFSTAAMTFTNSSGRSWLM